jgi:solute:Na+ symporter, SSS family
LPQWADTIGQWKAFPINGQYMYFLAMLSAVLAYILVSLLGPRKVHNMDKLLHRGSYAIADDTVDTSGRQPSGLARFLGISSEYTRADRAIHYGTFFYTMVNLVIFLVGTAYALYRQYQGNPVADGAWLILWRLFFYSMLFLAVVTVVWFFIGGLWDMNSMFRILKSARRDTQDDGSVRNEIELGRVDAGPSEECVGRSSRVPPP